MEIRDLDVADYREQVVQTLSSARDTAVQAIRRAQGRYKFYYDRKAHSQTFKMGDWAFVRFPQDETGKRRKLSRPWHGPYRVTDLPEPDVCLTSVYYPDSRMKVHLSRVKQCPSNLPAGFYWYGGNKKSLGHTLSWVAELLTDDHALPEEEAGDDVERGGDSDDDDRSDDVAETRPDVAVTRPETTERIHKRYPLRGRLQPPDRLGFARDEQV